MVRPVKIIYEETKQSNTIFYEESDQITMPCSMAAGIRFDIQHITIMLCGLFRFVGLISL